MSVVGGLFSDVFRSQGMAVPADGAPPAGTIDWSKQAGNAAPLDWQSIKPYQVIGPMSWAATNKDATTPEEAKQKLDSLESTDTRSEYEKWLASQQGDKGGSGGMDRTGGLAGNGTNYTDRQWAEIKAIRDEYGGMNNPFDSGQLKNAAIGLGGVLFGAPGLIASNYNDMQQRVRESDSFLNNRIAATDGVTPTMTSPVGYDPVSGNFSWSPTTTALQAGYSVGPTENSRASRDAQSSSESTSSESRTSNTGGGYTGAGSDRD